MTDTIWTADQPESDGFVPIKWSATLTSQTLTFSCHLSLRSGAWYPGTHRLASAAYGCAEREAARRNKSAARDHAA